MPRRPRPWNGSLRAKKGWILLSVKDSAGNWPERSTGLPDTPEGWREAERLKAKIVADLKARVPREPLRLTVWQADVHGMPSDAFVSVPPFLCRQAPASWSSPASTSGSRWTR